MLIFEKVPDLKYVKQPFKLPYDKKAPLEGKACILLVRDTVDTVGILKETKIKLDRQYVRYYKPAKYNDKIFNKQIRYIQSPTDLKDMSSFTRTLNLMFVHKSNALKTKNVLVDTSPFHKAFLDNITGKNYIVIAESYLNHLVYYIDQQKLSHVDKYLIVDASQWGISSKKDISITSKALNPINIIYYLLRKKPEVVSKLKGYTLIVLDGDSGWFKWTIGDIEETTAYQSFYHCFQLFKNDEISLDIQTVEEEEQKMSSARAAAIELSKEEIENAMEDEDEESQSEGEKIVGMGDDTEEGLTQEQIEQELNEEHEDALRATVDNKRLKMLMERQHEIKLGKVKLGDIKGHKTRDYHIEEVSIADKIFTPNEGLKKIRFNNFNRSYGEKVLDHDIMNIVMGLNDKRDYPLFVKDVKKTDTSTAMDLKYTYEIALEDINHGRHKITVDIPRVYDGNYLYLGGNKKQLITQQVPLVLYKTKPDEVQICTNYKKVFMNRYGDILSPKITIFKKIILGHPELFDVVKGNGCALSNGHMTSIEYDQLAKDFVEIRAKKHNFRLRLDQEYYDNLVKEKKLESIYEDFLYCAEDLEKSTANKKRCFVCTIKEGNDAGTAPNDVETSATPDVKTNNGGPIDVFCQMYKNKTNTDFWDLAGPHDKAGKKFMYSRCTIMAKKIPTIILLSYFEGLTSVMNKAGIQYEFSDKRKHINEDQGIYQFADGYLIYKRTPTEASLLMNGLSIIDTKLYKYSDMDQTGAYLDIFDVCFNHERRLASAFDAFYDNFIDPITKEVLEELDLPTNFVELFLAANQLLGDNNFVSELDASQYRIRNLEMINAFLHQAISDAYSNYRRNAASKNPPKVSIQRNVVIKEILTSNATRDVSVINPITELETLNAVTCRGPVGINLDRAYTKPKRCFDKSMTGYVGMSTSPDANCGIARTLTIEPKIMNTRGLIDTKKPVSEMKDVNVFTYAEALTPLAVTNDDQIRVSMAVKQSKHIIPVKEMSPVLISTGVEKTLPYVVGKDFVIRAKDSGKVKEYDEKNKMMVLEYKDGSHEVINLNPVVVKNGGGGFYLSNILKTEYKVGNSFKKNDVIAYNKDYFSEHFDGCKFNIGTLCKAACMSSFATYEDSKTITANFSKRLATEMVMKKHVVLGPNATIESIVKKGQDIHVGDNLIVFEQSSQEKEVNQLLRGIGDDLKQEITDMGKSAVRSKYNGVIEDIRIYSSIEGKEMSPSLRKVVEEYWKSINDKKKFIRKYHIEDPTYQGQTYYEMDGPIKPDSSGKVKGYKLEEGVVIEFYIKFYDPAGVGDKLCDFAALKGVTSLVIPEGEEPYTLDRPNEEISTIYPASSILARKVPSILLTMWGNKLLIELKNQLKEIYETGSVQSKYEKY